jgi:hypothetical protein
MRKFMQAIAATALAVPVLTVVAAPIGNGWISTDRLGYTGTITKQGGTAIQTGDRDLSLFGASNATPLTTQNAAIVMGSWWYTTSTSGPGWGNVNGNTGPGFMQYYDLPSSAQVVKTSYSFGGFDGTYWTEFTYLLEVVDGSAFARLSAPQNTGDGGIYNSLIVALTVTGLEGVESGGWITATNQPTGVTGSITGQFENTSATTANNGIYDFDFSLNMTNWAWTNRDGLVGSQFRSSSFGALAPRNDVPEPSALMLVAVALVGAGLASRRRVTVA